MPGGSGPRTAVDRYTNGPRTDRNGMKGPRPEAMDGGRPRSKINNHDDSVTIGSGHIRQTRATGRDRPRPLCPVLLRVCSRTLPRSVPRAFTSISGYIYICISLRPSPALYYSTCTRTFPAITRREIPRGRRRTGGVPDNRHRNKPRCNFYTRGEESRRVSHTRARAPAPDRSPRFARNSSSSFTCAAEVLFGPAYACGRFTFNAAAAVLT